MPKYELKSIAEELSSGVFWPVYWIYGTESYKIREVLGRIRSALTGTSEGSSSEQVFDGASVSVLEVIEATQSPSLFGARPFVIVRGAHLLGEIEKLLPLMLPKLKYVSGQAPDFTLVCIAKDLDGRKKSSKLLVDKVAVIPCEEVTEHQKPAWIQFLAKKKKITLTQLQTNYFQSLDPWSLDRIVLELDKLEVGLWNGGMTAEELLGLSSWSMQGGSDEFLEAFFTKKKERLLPMLAQLAVNPEDVFPLLGLLGWNLRSLALFVLGKSAGKSAAGNNPYLLDKLKRWGPHWKFDEIVAVQQELYEIDYAMKQKPSLSLGLWTILASRLSEKSVATP